MIDDQFDAAAGIVNAVLIDAALIAIVLLAVHLFAWL